MPTLSHQAHSADITFPRLFLALLGFGERQLRQPRLFRSSLSSGSMPYFSNVSRQASSKRSCAERSCESSSAASRPGSSSNLSRDYSSRWLPEFYDGSASRTHMVPDAHEKKEDGAFGKAAGREFLCLWPSFQLVLPGLCPHASSATILPAAGTTSGQSGYLPGKTSAHFA
jgi:hypothetical protein